MIVRCPACRNTFSSERTGLQECPVCGKPLVVPEPAGMPSPSSVDDATGGAPAAVEPGTPWEQRAQVGAWKAWRDTVVEALFEPGRLFASARIDRAAAQTGFAVLTVSVFWIAGQMLERFLLRHWTQRAFEVIVVRGQLGPMLQKLLIQAQSDNSPRAVLLMALLTPVVVLVGLYANAALTHLFAVLLGQNKRGFAATFTSCAYAFAPLVLFAIPGCGAPIAAVWAAVLTGIGLKHTHRIRPGGAAATVLAPYVLVCCGGCVLAAIIAATRISQ